MSTGMTALVVEDSVILAMETEWMLHYLGFDKVHVCGSSETALDILADGNVSVALLDIELGNSDTCAPIVLHLTGAGLPFIFVSGYDSLGSDHAEHASVPFVKKPFVLTDIERALEAIGVL